MKTTPHHIPFAQLADMAEGRLTTEGQATAREHIALCHSCSRQASELERVTALMRQDTFEDAPPDLLSGAIRMFRTRPVAERAPEGRLRRLIAALTFDSSSLTPAFGVRSGQAAPARQLLFCAGGMDIDLRLAPGSDGWTVSGQVLGPCTKGRVEMSGTTQESAMPAASELNELCEFILPPMPPGNYTLRLHLNDLEVEIPELHLNA